MPKRSFRVIADRRENGDIDWYAVGERARLEGRPIWANPGVGLEAERWRAGYWAAGPIVAPGPTSRPSEAIPEFA